MQLDGYIRVSQVGGRAGESFISPEVQREEVVHAISARGAHPGEIYKELNKSGIRASNRPRLMEAIERIEGGLSDGLVVARLSRFGRSFEDGVRLIGRIQRAGGTLISVREGFDLSTPTGRLVANILFSVAEWEVEAKRESWDDARRKRIERGHYICAKAPPGYRKTPSKRLAIDPVEGPVIAELFRRRLAGATMPELLEFLNASPVNSKSGKPFCDSRVYAIFQNSAYKGTAHSGRHEKSGAHEALVSAEEWQRAQSAPRRPRRWVESLLAGRIRCAACGGQLTSIRPRSTSSTSNIYRCRGELQSCARPATARSEELDPLLEELIFRGAAAAPTRGSDRKARTAEAAVARAEEDLIRYRDNVGLARTLGEERFEDGIAARVHFLERRTLDLGRAKRALEEPQIDLEELERTWHTLSWERRRMTLAQLVDLVVVERGTEPLIERAWVYRRGRGPLIEPGVQPDLRRPGNGSTRLRPHRRWALRRIEAELREFFAEREPRWPHYLEFAKAGRGRLHAQVLEWGGPFHWAPILGVEPPAKVLRGSQAQIRGALRPFLAGRERWPQRSEFRAAGLRNLYEGARKNGGLQYWAAEFGLEFVPVPGGRQSQWSEPRIEGELRKFLEDAKFFPRKDDFEAAGRADLYQALGRNGGRDHWAKRFGLPSVVGGCDARRSTTASGGS